MHFSVFFFQAEDGIRDKLVTGVQTCALPILAGAASASVPNSATVFTLILALRWSLVQRGRLTAPCGGGWRSPPSRHRVFSSRHHAEMHWRERWLRAGGACVRRSPRIPRPPPRRPPRSALPPRPWLVL